MAEPVRDDLVSDRPGTAAERASRCSRIPRLHAEAVAQRGRPPVAPTARPCRTATSTSLLRNACWYCPRPRLSSQRAMSIAVYPAWVTSPRMWPTPCRTRNRAGLTTFRRGSGVIQFTRPRSSPYAPCELTHMTTTPPALSWSTDVKSDLGSWEVLKEHGRGDNRRRSRQGRPPERRTARQIRQVRSGHEHWLRIPRFASDAPLEGSGFEPSVPLPRLSSIQAVRAEIIGRSTDVFRRDREFDVSALQGRLSTSSQSQCSTDPGPIAGTWHRPLFLTRDRWFESGSLQRRARC